VKKWVVLMGEQTAERNNSSTWNVTSLVDKNTNGAAMMIKDES